MYQARKTWGFDQGWSACFRQPFAKSHCSWLHGYDLSFSFLFEAERLDSNGWVIDFGGLKPVEASLKASFDHKLLVAETDPEKDLLCSLAGLGLADVVVMPAVGCEAFALFAYKKMADYLGTLPEHRTRVYCVEATCAEHKGNSASFIPYRS